MHRQGVANADTRETTPLLISDDHFHFAQSAGGSIADGTALRRNEQDGENMFTRIQ